MPRMESSVDLPAPEGPMTEMNSPGWTSTVMRRSTYMRPAGGGLSGTRLLDDPAVEQMDGTVGVGCVSGIVRDHADRRSTAMQLAQQLHNRFAVRRVEVSRRLVCEQDEWIPGNRTRDGDALLLTAGELCGIVLHAMAHADALESVLHALLALTARHAAVGKRELDVLIDGEIPDEVERSEDGTNLTVSDRCGLRL